MLYGRNALVGFRDLTTIDDVFPTLTVTTIDNDFPSQPGFTSNADCVQYYLDLGVRILARSSGPTRGSEYLGPRLENK